MDEKTKTRIKKYNLTEEEYLDLLRRANNACEICKNPAENLSKGICIDHSHTTGYVRGLLCFVCNKRLGNLGDCLGWLKIYAEFLPEAIKYLEKHETQKNSGIYFGKKKKSGKKSLK